MLNQPLELFGAAEVVEVGANAVAIFAPTFTGGSDGVEPSAFARVTVLSGALVAAWGDTPTASDASGWRIEAGAFALLPVTAGQGVSLIEAAVPASAMATALLRAEAVARSGAIATGGLAQDLMPANTDRNGWLIQNQSTTALYLQARGVDGASVATADPSSLLIPPGGYYEPPKITLEAVSIIGAATGQAFFAEEW